MISISPTLRRFHPRAAARFGAFGLALLAPLAAPQIARAQVSTLLPAPHIFVYKADKPLKSVAVAGTFNGWNAGANPMVADADGLTWRLALPLPYGKVEYKFVLDGSNWTPDPNAPSFVDGGGNTNSFLLLTPPDYARPARSNDGEIAKSALLHEMRAPYLNLDRGQLSLSLRARPGDLRSVKLRAAGKTVPMRLVSQNELYATYRGAIPFDGAKNLSYSFELDDGKAVRQFGARGLGSAPFRIIAKDFQAFKVPNWVERTVFYQIFPDRFENGDKSNDPKDVVAWNTKPEYFNRFGGDAAGVRQHLPYLKNLGISGVYFNPIFKSPSNHRYDATDFKRIDPEFGTNAEFAALTRDLQKNGIRSVMDFVFNHTATNFAPFADIRDKGESSAYKDWFTIKSYPVKVAEPPNYVAWFNYPSMPKLNLMNPQTGDYMLNLVDFWKKEVPLAGLRLDVADEVDQRFWRRLRTRVKGLDSQMWIVGERWGDASQWLQGDQWDASMNYPFLFANVEFFAESKIPATQFSKRLMENYNAYPPQVSRNMMNLLSSHDRPRFLTVARNNAKLHQLAATTQFTWPGAPSIYYGEEIGMQGGADPDNRRGMDWKSATPGNKMLIFYKKLIKIRGNSRALQSGDPKILLADDAKKSLAYSRTLGNDVALVALNRSESPQTLEIAAPRQTHWVDALGGKKFLASANGKLRMQLAPLSSAILLQAKEK